MNTNTDTICTLCGGARRWATADFQRHIRTEPHQAAIRAWDASHAVRRITREPTHHDGHVALRIACTCAQRLA